MVAFTTLRQLALLLSLLVSGGYSFIVPLCSSSSLSLSSSSSLSLSPLGGFSEEDERIITQIMDSKGLSRSAAEADYKNYASDPNSYALAKGEEYYRSLGYEKLMDGVIGEAEKEGRGAEVKARIEKFKRESR